MKKLFKFLSSRLTIICFFILFQLVLLFLAILVFTNNFLYFYLLMLLFSLGLIIAIVNDDSNPTFKIAWIIPMLILPIFGAPLYLIFGRKKVSKRIIKMLSNTFQIQNSDNRCDDYLLEEIDALDTNISKQAKYICNTTAGNIYVNTKTKFLATGEIFYKHFLEELKKAKKFIFLEYFIIAKGEMWNTILGILKKKASEGVDVRIIYDDLGTISLLEKDYPKYLTKFGIKTQVFNPFHASLDSFLNYRDHRKLTIIDGNVGFTGGINLADEYINIIERFGHWKDSSVMLKGDGVSKLTTMFLQIWYFLNLDEQPDFTSYFSTEHYNTDGYVIPFSDSPLTGHLTGELAYMNMINHAKRYVNITTPYLILDNEMITALKLASESGIDIRIITPHIPDKAFVHAVTQANYLPLLKSGIKIYEYIPGFIHAKTIVADDEVAIVGTTNFDFRSFYLHFENSVFMYKSKCVNEVKSEFEKLLDESKEITIESYNNMPWIKRFKGKVLKLFSPMM